MPFRFHCTSVTRDQAGEHASRFRKRAIFLLIFLWAIIYGASLFSPSLLDDADATHAQAAQAMLRTGDWVTLHVDGVRYLEKPPLPYWITALSLRLFGDNSFAVHLPLALTVLGLALLAFCWGGRAFGTITAELGSRSSNNEMQEFAPIDGDKVGFYAALFLLTSTGVFLFTRVFIPDALLSLCLAFILYAALRALERDDAAGRRWALFAWIALAAAVLTKGLVAIAFILGTFALYLPLAGEWRHWRRLTPLRGTMLFLAVAAPWHILAGLRNRGGADGHGFFWFYFINEHVLRFLGRRSPPDYNKLPAALYWSLHLVWLFPWSFFLPVIALIAWQKRTQWMPGRNPATRSFAGRSVPLLLIFSALVLVFFSISTNQEYYTSPVYLPLLLLAAAALRYGEQEASTPQQIHVRRLLLISHWALAGFGWIVAVALAAALWSSRHLAAAPNVGDLLAHRDVGDYTLSMSHFFDLTDAAFSALRLPASLACAAFAIGPGVSLLLRLRARATASILALAFTSTVFLVAAHLALNRFASMLSSQDFAQKIQEMQRAGTIAPNAEVMIFGDQAFGSSIPFYLGRHVELVDGRSTSMLFGSTFPDAPPLFLTPQQLAASWGHNPRKLLFVPPEHRAEVESLLGSGAILVYQNSGKMLLTDRPLAHPQTATPVDRDVPRPEQ